MTKFNNHYMPNAMSAVAYSGNSHGLWHWGLTISSLGGVAVSTVMVVRMATCHWRISTPHVTRLAPKGLLQ